jgi:copper(I)-binding protein
VPITRSRQIRRSTVLAAAVVTLAGVISGCAVSPNAQTTTAYEVNEGANASSGSVAVRNMLVLASGDGRGRLYASIFNNGTADDTLTGISQAPAGAPMPDGTTATELPDPITFGGVRPITLPAGGSVILPPATGRPVTVTGAKPGYVVNVTVTFRTAAPLTVAIPVLPLDFYSPTPASGAQG